MSDALLLLEFLFLKPRESGLCLEAADVDNDGVIGLGDGIRLLHFLFQGGEPPAAPYPLPGADPDPPSSGGAGGGTIHWSCDDPLPIFVPTKGDTS
jgi:hypothetical protein